jgi:hypothetical protein
LIAGGIRRDSPPHCRDCNLPNHPINIHVKASFFEDIFNVKIRFLSYISISLQLSVFRTSKVRDRTAESLSLGPRLTTDIADFRRLDGVINPIGFCRSFRKVYKNPSKIAQNQSISSFLSPFLSIQPYFRDLLANTRNLTPASSRSSHAADIQYMIDKGNIRHMHREMHCIRR